MSETDRAELIAENTDLRRRVAQWEMATLAALLRHLDSDTASRVGARIRELAAPVEPEDAA